MDERAVVACTRSADPGEADGTCKVEAPAELRASIRAGRGGNGGGGPSSDSELSARGAGAGSSCVAFEP